ncbi:hypothetical protein TPR58_17455 [Sphingomonas sp. HF-S3]|uniref:FAD-binding PCMH-type domain-containing protein n=1 Tax=Sphingomonas rustica TaxID=3103142 RepID=A0ABV0BDL3_9SPHN
MPSIRYDDHVAWSNYHLTLGARSAARPVPSMTIERLARIEAGDVAAQPGLARFAATAAPLMQHLATVRSDLGGRRPPGPAGMTGCSWSFSPVIGTPASQLACDGLSGAAGLDEGDRDPACTVAADRIALVSGGTRLRKLVDWGRPLGLTLMTSGTHLGATVAGSAGTASHGSRLGYGGIQNMVLGMHLITGATDHVWIERSSGPVLNAQGAARLEVAGARLRVVRDDDQFEDALVHLGSMGIVNGVAMEMVPIETFALLRRRATLDAAWLDDLAQGEFDRAAARLHCPVVPAFYEITLNPHAPFADEATHLMYVPRTASALLPPGDADIVRPADAIGLLGQWLTRSDATRPSAAGNALVGERDDPGGAVRRVLRRLLKDESSAFAYYRAIGKFEANSGPFDPEDPARPGYDWGALHGDEITGNTPGALYNASFAIPRDHLAAAIPAICRAVAHLEPSFVFSIRFVARPAGTLAFTRFEQNAVIEIDGLSGLICEVAAAGIDPSEPHAGEMLAALRALSTTLEKGAVAVRAALEAARIPSSMHWAKLGDLDKAKVQADFGHPADPESLIRRWRDTRDALLPEESRALFWNDHVVALGLLDRIGTAKR